MRHPAGEAAGTATEALQDALATEHAAVWCYSLAVAFLGAASADQARADLEDHREVRAAVEQAVTGLGARPAAAQPAYSTPDPVTDGPSAAALLVVAETDTLAAWRSVLERTSDRALRRTALDTLTAGTLRCARWRAVVGSPPAIPPFPGAG